MAYETVTELRARDLSTIRRAQLEQLVAHVGAEGDDVVDVRVVGGELTATMWRVRVTKVQFAVSPVASSIDTVFERTVDVMRTALGAEGGAGPNATRADRKEAVRVANGVATTAALQRMIDDIGLIVLEEV